MPRSAYILAQNMKVLRKRRGVSQEELAEQTGLSSQFVAALEQQRKEPSLTTLDSLSKALGVTVAELFVEQLEEALRRGQVIIEKLPNWYSPTLLATAKVELEANLLEVEKQIKELAERIIGVKHYLVSLGQEERVLYLELAKRAWPTVQEIYRSMQTALQTRAHLAAELQENYACTEYELVMSAKAGA